MKKDLLLIPVITLVLMFVALGLFSGCTDGGGADADYDSLTVDKDTVFPKDTATVTAHVSGPEANKVTYDWAAPDGGTVVGDTHWSVSQVLWIAPDTGGTFEIRCNVSRGEPDWQEKSVNITVIEEE
jgi:hypothetical protein